MVLDAFLDAIDFQQSTRFQGMVLKSFQPKYQLKSIPEHRCRLEIVVNSKTILAQAYEERCREAATRKDRTYCVV